MSFLRGCWYVVAWDHELPAEGLFARTVLNEPLLLFRTAAGTVVALEDRCCHRLAPLSKGRREGDSVRCGYHGLRFDASGQCVEIPGSDRIPPQTRVRAYPVAVKNRWVFVWMGEPGRADPALLPDNFSCDHPDWRNKPGYLRFEAPYLLVCDNLLDFSHLSYVHEKSLGGSSAIAHTPPAIERLARGLRVSRHVADVPAPPYYRKLREFSGNIDRWLIYDFLLPGTLLMDSGGRPRGAPLEDERGTVRLHSCQALTPETDATTHYFFQQSHAAHLGDDSVTEGFHAALVAAFHEDRDMIAAQYRSIQRSPTAPMQPLAFDSALTQFRRLVEREIATERGAPNLSEESHVQP